MAYGVVNVYVPETDTLIAQAVECTFGEPDEGTGNISVTAGSKILSGTGTNFTSLGNLYVIWKWPHSVYGPQEIYIGKIKEVISDTSAILVANSAITWSTGKDPSNWKYSTYTQAVIDFDENTWRFTDDIHRGNGTITVSNTTNIINGVGTAFAKQFEIGTQVFATFANAGPILSGAGNITSNVSSTTITGVNTNFEIELANNFVILSNTGSYIGTVSNVVSNTNITLTANALSTVTNKEFKFKPLTEMLLGVIKNTFSNTQAEFTSICKYTENNLNYRFFDAITQNQPNVMVKGQNVISKSLINWSRSGLIPNIEQIKSYHPPVPDPVTGILVNFPATVHKSRSSGKRLHAAKLNPIDDTDSSPGNSNHYGVTKDFDFENGIIGSSTHKAIESIPLNKYIKKLTQSNAFTDNTYVTTLTNSITAIYGNAVVTNPGIVLENIPEDFVYSTTLNSNSSPFIAYEGPGANVVYIENKTVTSNLYPTTADTLAVLCGLPAPKRITDERSSANVYFSTPNPIGALTESQKFDLAARANNQFSLSTNKRVKTTRVPAAIPGLLNVVLADENPTNRQFANVQYEGTAYVPISTTFNRDYPVSTVNTAPKQKVYNVPSKGTNN